MRNKILTLNLLLALVFLPVTHAMTPHLMPAEHDHGIPVMDCDHADPGHCGDRDACVAGGHASCDTNLKAAQLMPQSAAPPGSDAFATELAEGFLSHHPELLLRPPRSA